MRKKITALLATACLTFSTLAISSSALSEFDFAVETEESFSVNLAEETEYVFEGLGTKESPFLISSAENMLTLAELVNSGDANYNSAYYKLENNIDFSGVEYVPIGRITVKLNNNSTEVEDVKYPFSGHFDGNGYALKNITITEGLRCVGVFGYGKNASVYNLRVENISIDATRENSLYAGALFGCYDGNYQGENLAISHCYVQGVISSESTGLNASTGGVAGIVKVPFNQVDISDCRVDIDIKNVSKTTSYAGGLVGKVETGAYITNCVATGSVYGEATGDASSTVGALVAWLEYSDWVGSAGEEEVVLTADPVSMENCLNSVKVQSVGKYSPRCSNAVGYILGTVAKNCYFDVSNSVTSKTGYSGTGIALSELFSDSKLTSLGFDKNLWKIYKDVPELAMSITEIGYTVEKNGEITANITTGEVCEIYAVAYSGNRVCSTKIKAFDGKNNVTFNFDGVTYDYVKLYALENNLNPVCDATTLSK